MRRKFIKLLFLFMLLPCAGTAPAQAIDEKSIEITVIQNDSVIGICEKYLEEPSRWSDIARLNRLKNHDLIHPGQRLFIPVRYLKGLPVSGRVSFVKGDVSVRTNPKDTWKAVNVSDVILQGQTVRTGPESVVEIVFEDGTSFFQRPETLLEMNQSQRKTDDSLWQRFVLRSGQMLLKVRRSLGRESRIEIQTPAAVAVARGTDFRVSMDAFQSMTSEVLDGKVDVQAMKKTVELTAGEGTRVRKGEPPLPPRKLLIPPALLDALPLYRSMPIRLRFSQVEGARSYRVSLSTDVEGKSLIREMPIRPNDTVSIAGLDDGVYYLHALSIDELGIEGFPSPEQKITVRVNPLPPFTQLPVDGASFKGKSVAWEWLRVSGADRYELEISPVPDFQRDVFSTQSTELSYRKLFSDFGTYYFRIRSVAADGFAGFWSDTLSFKLVPPPPAPPMEKPAMDEKEIRIRWKNQGEKMTYRVQVARDKQFLQPIVEQTVSRPEMILARPSESGIYYVRTSTLDADGYEGGFSAPQSFEIKSDQDVWVVLGAYGLMLLLIVLLP
ncbi:MAG: FecR domain-containing protein [Smithellaceae bacterium]